MRNPFKYFESKHRNRKLSFRGIPSIRTRRPFPLKGKFLRELMKFTIRETVDWKTPSSSLSCLSKIDEEPSFRNENLDFVDEIGPNMEPSGRLRLFFTTTTTTINIKPLNNELLMKVR